jgi:hypothetical protein
MRTVADRSPFRPRRSFGLSCVQTYFPDVVDPDEPIIAFVEDYRAAVLGMPAGYAV